MRFRGSKNYRGFTLFLEDNLPSDMSLYTYIEPFGGSFCIVDKLSETPAKTVYNDIIDYEFDIVADVIEHVDYKTILDRYSSDTSIFYLDPPYYGKEDYYNNDLKIKDKEFHIDLYNKLTSIESRWILSYEDVPFIRNLYGKHFEIVKFSDFSDQKILRNEILIKNF